MPAKNTVVIRRDFPRPDRELVEGFHGVTTGFVVDAPSRRGALGHLIHAIHDGGPCVGPALTCWTIPRGNLTPYVALSVSKPGDVLVATNGGATDASILGNLLLGVAGNRGIAAVVTDNLVRDVDGIEEAGIPVYADGLSANSPFKNGPGDIVGGDRDGVVVVPPPRAREVLDTLLGVRKKEAEMEAAIHGGLDAPAWLHGILDSDRVRYLDTPGA
ncbi:MAG: hypothetical protein OXE86_05035 [Alphaproteobacteria bacterium]|nr:hypothetical protein [Alphaproteobacteria bacterium]